MIVIFLILSILIRSGAQNSNIQKLLAFTFSRKTELSKYITNLMIEL